jgi:hypothetical protein
MMRKSSRFWWLHGAILLSAVIGCKSANSGGGYGAPAGGPTMSGSSPMIGSGVPSGGTMFPTTGTPTYTSPSTSGGQTFAPQMGSGSGYPMPTTSTSMSQGFGGGMPR